MTETTRLMLLIKSIDPGAHLELSEWTHGWYVSSRSDIGDGVLLKGIAEHRDDPDSAVAAYFERLTSIGVDEYIATTYCDHRREWRWNGVAFREQTRSEALPEPRESVR